MIFSSMMSPLIHLFLDEFSFVSLFYLSVFLGVDKRTNLSHLIEKGLIKGD